MEKSGKKSPKGKKTLNVKDLPAKPKGGGAIKGGLLSRAGKTSPI